MNRPAGECTDSGFGSDAPVAVRSLLSQVAAAQGSLNHAEALVWTA